jgi:hypothetical protein
LVDLSLCSSTAFDREHVHKKLVLPNRNLENGTPISTSTKYQTIGIKAATSYLIDKLTVSH